MTTSLRPRHRIVLPSTPAALLLAAAPALATVLTAGTGFGQAGTTVLHCNVVGIGGDNASFRGIRFHVDQSFTAVEVHVEANAAGAYSFDVELRRSTGFVDPVEATASAAVVLAGTPGMRPYQTLLLDFGQVIPVGGATETFTLKALNVSGTGTMYWEVAGINNIPCPDAEVTEQNNVANPATRTSACGLRVIDASGPQMVGTNYCQANANSTGQTGLISGFGSAMVAANDLRLEASRLPLSSFGYFLTSVTQAQVPNPGGSQGVLCLGGNIGRYVGPGQILNTGATGGYALQLDLTQIPTPTGTVAAMVGETRSFQSWHRDSVAGVATSNFTDGLSVTFL